MIVVAISLKCIALNRPRLLDSLLDDSFSQFILHSSSVVLVVLSVLLMLFTNLAAFLWIASSALLWVVVKVGSHTVLAYSSTGPKAGEDMISIARQKLVTYIMGPCDLH